MDGAKEAREPKVRLIEKSLNNLDGVLRRLEDFVASLDTNQLETQVKGKEESSLTEFQLWNSLNERINVSVERIRKIEAFLKEKLR